MADNSFIQTGVSINDGVGDSITVASGAVNIVSNTMNISAGTGTFLITDTAGNQFKMIQTPASQMSIFAANSGAGSGLALGVSGAASGYAMVFDNLGNTYVNALTTFINNASISAASITAATFAHPPAITNGYFAGATVTKAAGSGDTTGVCSFGITTGFTTTIKYTPGTEPTAGVVFLHVAYASALATAVNPFVGQVTLTNSSGASDSQRIVVINSTTSGFDLFNNDADLNAGFEWEFVICILP